MRPQFLRSSEPGLSRPEQTIRLSSPTPSGIWGSSNIAPAISGKRVAT
jgi:hypothetical protein